MKKILYTFIFFSMLLCSCVTSRKEINSPFTIFVDGYGLPNILAEYLMFNSETSTFEYVIEKTGTTTFGNYIINKDTIFLVYQYDRHIADTSLILKRTKLLDENNMPNKFIVRDDSLIDITDYSSFLSDGLIKDFATNLKVDDIRRHYKRVK